MEEIKKNIVLIGGGGHCISVIDIIENGNEFELFLLSLVVLEVIIL